MIHVNMKRNVAGMLCMRPRRRLVVTLIYVVVISVSLWLVHHHFRPRHNDRLTRFTSHYDVNAQRYLASLDELEPMYNRLKKSPNDSDVIYIRKIFIRRMDPEISLAYIKKEDRLIREASQYWENEVQPHWFNFRRKSIQKVVEVPWTPLLMVPQKFFAATKRVNKQFRYVLNHPAICNVANLHTVVLVTSYLHNQANRMAIRHSWGRLLKVRGATIRVVFLLGTGAAYYQTLAEAEDAQFLDIVQQDFVDSFAQRTSKSMMAMQWVSEFCSNARFVMLLGDNVLPNFYKLIPYVQKLGVEKNLYLGKVRYKDSPNLSNDRFMAGNISWTTKFYPPFCERPFVILSADVVDKMAAIVPYTFQMYPEDVYVGILAAKLGVRAWDFGTALRHMTTSDDYRQLLSDATSPVMLVDVIDDGQLPSLIIQTTSYIDAVTRDKAGVERSRRRIQPVTIGDVFLEA